MNENSQNLNFLPADTIRLLSSSQTITSISSVVKELFENALDAGSSSIQIKLENFGLDLMEIRDDGFGISGENVHKMFLPGYTSKISQFSDLDNLETYGFRGQALAALCSVADVSITTKTEKDSLAMTYVINKNGIPVSSAPSHLLKGTIISVKNLFKALPVRKQFASDKRKKATELKNVENVVKALAVVNNELRVVLIHNKNTIWQKNSVHGIKQSLMQVFSLKIVSKMEHLTEKLENMNLEMIVPKKDEKDAQLLFQPAPNNLLFINKRPISCKEISKVIEELIKQHFSISDQFPMFLASFHLPPSGIDVNLEPNKTKVLLKNLPDVLALLLKCLQTYYGILGPVQETRQELVEEELPSKRAKFDDSFMIEDRPQKPATVCSEINKQNCVLASEREVSGLTDKLSSQQMITASCQILREDIQKPPSEQTEHVLTQQLFDKALVSIENSKKKPELSVLDWSRGAVGLSSGDVLPAGAKVVVQIAEPVREDCLKDKTGGGVFEMVPRAAAIGNDVAKFDLSLPSVSSQLGRKQLTGFTKFARIMRPKIIAENPNINFSEVSSLLGERWKALTTDERAYYDSVAKAVDEQRKTHQEKKIQTTIKPKFHPPSRPDRRKITFTTSLAKITALREKTPPKCHSLLRLIGQLNDEWIYAKNQEIGLLRSRALDEFVLYQKMLSNFEIPAKELPEKICLTKNQLGGNMWEILLKLETEFDKQKCVDILTSPVIAKNGFRLELRKTGNGDIVSLLLTHGPMESESVVDQLKEALKLYESFGEYASMVDLRPESIKNFITVEVQRIINEKPNKPNRGEAAALLKTWRDCLSHLPAKDLANCDIFVPIYELDVIN